MTPDPTDEPIDLEEAPDHMKPGLDELIEIKERNDADSVSARKTDEGFDITLHYVRP